MALTMVLAVVIESFENAAVNLESWVGSDMCQCKTVGQVWSLYIREENGQKNESVRVLPFCMKNESKSGDTVHIGLRKRKGAAKYQEQVEGVEYIKGMLRKTECAKRRGSKGTGEERC